MIDSKLEGVSRERNEDTLQASNGPLSLCTKREQKVAVSPMALCSVHSSWQRAPAFISSLYELVQTNDMQVRPRRLLLALAVFATAILVYVGSQYGLLEEGGKVEINKCTQTHVYPSYYKLSMDQKSHYAGKYELFYYSDELTSRANVRPYARLHICGILVHTHALEAHWLRSSLIGVLKMHKLVEPVPRLS